MITSAPASTDLLFTVTHEIRIDAPLEATFAALLEEIGPANMTPDGAPLPMVLEAFPGGRWYRDLGHDNGHFWGHVQAIKRPTLLEICGPLFMSYAVANNLVYRLAADGSGTKLTLTHRALGVIADEHRDGLSRGWLAIVERVRTHAERARG